jgi:hypothetical protein
MRERPVFDAGRLREMRPGDDEPEIHFIEDGGAPAPHGHPPDVIDTQRRASPLDRIGARRLAIAAVVAALAVGVGLGYLSGTHSSKTKATPAAAPTPSATTSSPPDFPISLTPTGARCSLQSGNVLQLGIEIHNGYPDRVTLDSATVEVPLGGLRVIRSARGTCGQLPAQIGNDVGGDDIAGYDLAPGQNAWLVARVRVLVTCPSPLPVQFEVAYTRAGRHATTLLGGFPDLGGVPYTGCTDQH